MKSILFKTEFVKKIMDGLKTQTRRKMPFVWDEKLSMFRDNKGMPHSDDFVFHMARYEIGDELYVKEKWRTTWIFDDLSPSGIKNFSLVQYPDTMKQDGVDWGRWRQALHMPEWASRVKIRITNCRVEKLLDISERDVCLDLGVPLEWPGPGPEPYKRNLRLGFFTLWTDMHKKPLDIEERVYVYDFERIQED